MKTFTHYVVETEGWYMTDTGFGYDFDRERQFARLFNSKEDANKALASMGEDADGCTATVKEWTTTEKD